LTRNEAPNVTTRSLVTQSWLILRQTLLARVFEVIEKLPPDMQDLLVLAAFCEDSHAEIAAQLGITENAAKMRLVRARKMLRKRAGSIRDHIGVRLLFVLRKLAEARAPLFARSRMVLWQTTHLLPPVFIGLATLSQLESMPPTAAVEYAKLAPTGTESSLYVPDDRHASTIAAIPVTEKPSKITPPPPRPTAARVSDKPRRQTQPHRDFAVVLPASDSFIDDAR
jgi:Sigma-70, region 4